MAHELIISEKPAACKKIADALADGKAIKESINKVPYYKITHGKKDIIVACAVGHLYSLTQKEGKKWSFPVFDIEWKPSSEVSRTSKFSKKYLQVIKKLAKEADEFTVATDYDTEGEVIGLNIVRYACNKKDAARMKFSTLTKPDLTEAYNNKSDKLDWGQAEAGETRHFLDWYNGINYSRALTHAIKTAGAFKIMSTGRVQGPALKIIVDREKEIKAFKPVPFWQIQLNGIIKNEDIEAWHKKDKFWEKKEADDVMKKTKAQKKGVVDKIEKKQYKQMPPTPFDLTALQIESYRCFGIQPKETLSIAQELYSSGFISYPRTSSQKLPEKLGYKKIFTQLAKQKDYTKLCNQLLKKQLKPNEGRKTDPAHPAIYPTGIKPRLANKEQKVYDLIVKRFMATFSEPAERETMIVDINVKDEIFIAKGTRTISKGWHTYYEPYVKLEEVELPKVNKGDNVDIKKITLHDKETQPPKRYTPASIIKELEKRNLGTKCLTSNNFVKINSNNQIHTKNIAELFDDLYSNFPMKHKDMKIAINHKKTCFSFNEFDEIRSHFKLMSKRKLNKNEKVYRIEYKGGSCIELTEEHPILIFDGNSCKYIRTKNLKKDMKSVASMNFPEKEGNVICTWEEFLEKCKVRTQLYGVSNEIQILRKKQKLSQYSFGKKYNISQPRVAKYEKSQNIPLYIIKKLRLSRSKYIFSGNKNVKIKNPFPLRINSPLARILANLVGDCSIDSKKIIKENCYDFRYHNTDINLIDRFIKDIRNIFDINLKIKLAKPKQGHLPKYYVRLPAVIGRIISVLFSNVIKKNAVKISPDFYPEFIGSLFDDEGHSMKSEPKLFISNTNFKLLEDVKKMLENLGIHASIEKKQFKLYIRSRENLQKFLEKIPFYSIKKKQRLINNLSTFYKFGRGLSSPQKQYIIINALNASPTKELTNRKLSEKLGFNMAKSKYYLNLLIKNGYIKKIIKGISEYPRKRISYRLIRPIEETFFIYLDEKVISSDFITKTITSVKKIDYSGFVYDITNNSENPNFILSNGVVVHNSTRSDIIETLFNRHYISDTKIQATGLGIKTIETLEKHCPRIIDEALTRHFEEEMEKISNGQQNKKVVLEEAKETLVKTLDRFRKEEKAIGKELLEAERETRDEINFIGKCPACKKGNLQLRRGKFGMFIACNKYPKCKTTFKLPSNALIRPAKKECKTCNMPMILAIKKGRRPREFCINPKCKSKHVEGDAGKQAKEIAKGTVEKDCPKCKKGKLVLRKSIYGSFYGCSRFPKCRYTEKLKGEAQKEGFEKK